MSQPRFLADEDLRFTIVRSVRRMNPQIPIRTIVELGRSGDPDEQVLEFANVQGLIVISHDVNTMRAAAEQRIATGDGIAGLFLVPQVRTIRQVAESIVLVWSASEAEEWIDRIVYLPI